MLGLGKIYVLNFMCVMGDWFYYFVDYCIGMCYMGEVIVDYVKFEVMKVLYLCEFLLSDSIYIGNNIIFENFVLFLVYLGKSGDFVKGGVFFNEYMCC